MEEFCNQINAIARGVEVKQDLLTGHSKIVTQRTIDIARQLSIPEEAIKRWASVRLTLDSESSAVIESSLNKLRQSPFAQTIMGTMELYLYRYNSIDYQN